MAMHLLLIVSLLLVPASVVALAIGYSADGDREEGLRLNLLRIGWGASIVGLGIWVALGFGQPMLCDALGGEWFARPEACRHELGGNGNNNPGNWPYLWT
jgi:hypothetical protein